MVSYDCHACGSQKPVIYQCDICKRRLCENCFSGGPCAALPAGTDGCPGRYEPYPNER